jgi:hypothetical protein
MKKTVIAFLSIASMLVLTNLTFATYQEPEETIPGDPVVLEAIQNTDGKVELSWTEYEGNDFRGYKVVHSTTEENPVYPENGYLIYITDIKTLNYTHKEVKEGDNFYRICTLTANDKLCGNTVKITSTVDLSEENIEKTADEYSDNPNLAPILTVKKTDKNKAELSWTKYEEGDLKWYKIVRSTTNKVPYYPNDGYIGVNSYASQTSFLDEKPMGGNNYYRVCVITTNKERACSNVVKLEFDITGEMPFTYYFPDTKNHWARDYVNTLAKLDIVKGIDGNFMPENNVLRSEALKMILYAYDKKDDTCDPTTFSDVKKGEWFCGVATHAKKIRIIEGINGKFLPTRNVTRAEAVKILIETRGDIMSMVSLNPFTDVNKDAWHAKYVYHAKRLGFVSGKDGKFEPDRPITRAELAKIISISLDTEVSK